MADPRIDVIRRLARREAWPALRRTLQKSRSEDIAAAVDHLPPSLQRRVVKDVEDEEKTAEIISLISGSTLQSVLSVFPFDQLLALLAFLPVDDEADVISALPEPLQRRVLAAIKGEEKEQVEDLLSWPEDSAGGLMHPAPFRLQSELTCRDAISALQDADDLEMVFYLYVENSMDQLVGVTSLRALLTHPPSTTLEDLVTTELISVAPETDQEEVARVVSRYDLLAIPVLDPDRRMLGIITIDDIVDVIKEEAAEDMMLMAGVGDNITSHTQSVFSSFKQRLTWLMITLFGGIGMAELIGLFEESLQAQAVLAGFIPVMLGTGGNVGTQAATIAVRNIATGHVGSFGTLPMLYREARVGTLLGFTFAAVLGGYALIRWMEPRLGIAIGAALIIIVICAATLGMLVPITLNRLGIDPAVATGPFVTTIIDLIAILIYFSICGLILG
ncbi:MAG: magnesium transporter [Myxococcota bacterium]|nr:magnesium transporter [Myxococcota bacterium]